MSCPRPRPGTLLFEATAAAVPILLFANGFGVEAEAGELGPFPETAFEFGEAGELRQADDVVPERACSLGARQPTDHRAEERGAIGRLEMQYRGADVAAGQCERLLGLRADLVIER